MKSKIFALAIALLMAASSVSALAFEIEYVETGEEISSQTDIRVEKTASEFMTDEIVPGKNLLTGTTEPWTFDDGVGNNGSYGEDIVEVITLDDQNNVLKVTWHSTDGNAGYHNGIYLLNSTTAVNRKLRISFKLKSDVGLATTYGKMLLNPYKDGKFVGSRPNVGEKTESDGWTTFYADTAEDMDINAIVTHAGHQAAKYVDYYDDISIMPFYKVTYKNIAGDVLKEEYVEPDKSAFTLPSGTQFGFTRGAKYIASDKTEYLAGYAYPLAFEDVELTVVDTNIQVLVYEGFDTIGADHEFNETGKGFTATPSYDGLGNVSIVNGDDTEANNLHITTVDDGGNTVARITGSRGKYSCVGFKFLHLNFTQPGTYHINVNVKMESGNVATRLWTQAFGSKAPSMEQINVFPADVWHTVGWTVDVSKDGSGKYMYTISNSNGNVNSFESDSAFSDTVWQVYFAPYAANVVVYVDDLSITYEAPKAVTTTFVELGKVLTTDCYEGKYILPTAEQLGLKYNPAFEIDGKDYFPGEAYTVPENATAITVYVKETKVILNENFGKRYIHTVPSTAGGIIHDFSYKAPGYDGGLAGADFNDAKVLTTKTVNGRNVLELADINATNYHCLGVYGISAVKAPGTYVFKVVLKTPEGFNGGLVLNDKQGGYSAASGWINQREPDDDGFITVSFSMELYKKEDGTLYIQYSDNEGSHEKAYTDEMLTNMMFYVHTGTATVATIWFDEISVEFTPYAPTTVDKVSYRTESSNAGIRVAAYVNAKQKIACSEYGFIVARKTHLETAAANNGGMYSDYLSLDGVTDEIGTKTTLAKNSHNVLLVAAAGYKDNVDRVYTDDGSVFGNEYTGLSNGVWFYTGVLTGIKTAEQKTEIYVARPYIKVNGMYYYGSIKEVSYSNFFPSENA